MYKVCTVILFYPTLLTFASIGDLEQAGMLIKRCGYMAQRAFKPNAKLVAVCEMNMAEFHWLNGRVEEAVDVQSKFKM